VGQFVEVVKDAVRIEVYGVTYVVASLDSLIRSKRAADRPKDRSAVPELEALKEIKSRERQ
jgi:hypothetical protein